MLPDHLDHGLTAVFVGSSVATASTASGHYYSGPGNQFWGLLWEAGLTGDERLVPEQDDMLMKFGLGVTDVVKGRAASADSLLRRADYDVPAFLRKIETFKPHLVAFNGITVAGKVFRAMNEPNPSLGASRVRIAGAKVFVLPSSSRANADPCNYLPKATKADWWIELGELLRASGRLPPRIG
jgi:double-stranded uracil-DNA glycosylase